MGYETKYKLTITPATKRIKIHHDLVCGLDIFPSDFLDLLEGATVCMKWHNHKYDIMQLSQAYPEARFLLEGEGAESGDIWRLYAKNGMYKKIYAEIVFEDAGWSDLV